MLYNIYIHATMMNGRSRSIEFNYNPGTNDPVKHGLALLRKRMRKPCLWYGVGYKVRALDGIYLYEGTFEEK